MPENLLWVHKNAKVRCFVPDNFSGYIEQYQLIQMFYSDDALWRKYENLGSSTPSELILWEK